MENLKIQLKRCSQCHPIDLKISKPNMNKKSHPYKDKDSIDKDKNIDLDSLSDSGYELAEVIYIFPFHMKIKL